MPNIIEIADLNAPELDAFARLTEAQLRARQEPEKGLFIAEGLTVIGHALDAGCVPVALLVERRHITGKARSLIERCEGVPVYTADSDVLARLTGFELTRGVLCAMRRPSSADVWQLVRDARRVAILENIVDPTNVGAIFRSAAALGVEALLLSPACCDPLNRRSIRVSMGTVFQLPWARVCRDADQWPHPSLDRLKSLGFKTAAMALSQNAISIENLTLRAEERLAILLGSEGYGLSPAAVAACDHCVMIPMTNGVDSLNVAAASAVAFWQLRPADK